MKFSGPVSGTSTSLNPTAASLLGFLHDGPKTGWTLATTVESALGGFWNVTRSQVYRELRTLDVAGLITAGERGPRERRPYSLTEAGRAAFAEWIAREPSEEIIRYPLLLTIFFADHVAPDRLTRSLRAHQLRHQARLDAYQKIAEGVGSEPSGPALALRFGIEYEQGVLRWFESLPWLSTNR